MGISIEAWRARVGGFSPRMAFTSPMKREEVFAQFGSRRDKVQLCTFAMLLYTQLLLGIMMLSGDIEMNPGPGPDQITAYPCLVCDMTFDTDHKLQNHMDNAHVSHASHEPLHKCRQPECGAMFRYVYTRNRHERTAHNQQLYKCDCCPALFNRLKELNMHKKSVHDTCPTMCDVCFKRFTSVKNLNRHKREQHGNGYACNICGQCFKGQRGLKEHQTYEHSPEMQTVVCDICGVKCTNPTSLQVHRRCQHEIQHGGSDEPNLSKSAFKGFLKNFRYTPTPTITTPEPEQTSAHTTPEQPRDTDDCSPAKRQRVDSLDDEAPNDDSQTVSADASICEDAQIYLLDKKHYMIEDINKQLLEGPIKFILTIQCTLYKFSVDDSYVESSPTFQSTPRQILNDTEINLMLNEAIDDVLKKLAEFQRNGSGWIFESVVQVDLHIGKYRPLNASKFMQLPDSLKNKKALLNIKNSDDYCFLYCVLAHLHPLKQNANLTSGYMKYIRFEKSLPKVDGLDLEGINFPMKIADICKFEQKNPTMAINVYSYVNKKNEVEVFPLRISKLQCKNVINLMYQSSEGSLSHYVLVKSLSRLLNKKGNRKLYCPHCLHGFSRDELLQMHLPYCQIHSAQRIEMPAEGKNTMAFKDGEKQMPAPYILVADFECSIIKGTDGNDRHTANSFCLYKVAYSGEEVFDPIVYVGDDASDVFARRVEQESRWILDKQEENKKFNMSNMTDQEKAEHESAISCHICHKSFTDNDKVHDHCHVTGKYRGPAHRQCNLRYSVPAKIPLFMHNFSKYDLKVVVEGIRHTAKNISVIPENMENYIAMDVNKVRFLDSYRFLDASLESLVEKMRKTGPFTHASRWLKEQGYGDHIDLLLRKNAYPYEFIDSIEKLSSTEFPNISDFHSKIKGDTISQEEYDHAKHVYEVLNLPNFKAYHTLYLALDTLLLSDVLTAFRKRCLGDDGLDPVHYYTMPNYSFDAMLKSTNVQLELLTDPTMYLAFENNVRGGISVVSHRHAEANNPYMTDYDDTKPTSYLMYVDAVNLYGKAMLAPLPISDFRWVDDNEVDSFDITKVPDDGEDCYILEVDLTYPDHLHQSHSDYPLMPGPMLPSDDVLSPYCRNLKEKLGLGNTSSKLIPNLLPKHKYLVHFRNLKFYLKHGIVLEKIHRIIHCKQQAWLKDFVLANTEKRKLSNNTLDKDFYKKKNNSVYGKCEQNTRKYQRVELVNNVKRVKKLISDPSYLSHKIFFGDRDEGSLAAIHRMTTTLKLNKPIYAGFAILELSKLVMYEFYYDHLKRKYGDNMKLCYTDTDSLIFWAFTDDIYKDMLHDQHMYDTSEYPSDHFLYSPTNKKVPGKFSDELNSRVISAVSALRSKMYAIKVDGGEEKRRAKGVPRRIVSRDMRYDDYVNCLENRNVTSVEYSSIQSKNMQLYTTTTRKIGLSSFDDKRYILSDGKSTLAYGHCDITASN